MSSALSWDARAQAYEQICWMEKLRDKNRRLLLGDSVRGHLAHLDEDWEDYRLEALHAHIMPFYENELAARSKESSRRRRRDAARADIADRCGDSTEDDTMDID